MLVALAAAVLSALPVFAGEPVEAADGDYYPHSVYAGYSVVNVYARQNHDDINNFSGILNLGYEYRPLRRLGLGADIGWMNNVGKHRRQVDYAGGVSLPENIPFWTDYFLISANLRGIWVDRPHFSFYSGIRGGVTLKLEDKVCTTEANLQVIPIGLEAGAKRVGVYAELALGSTSNLSFGIRFHF